MIRKYFVLSAIMFVIVESNAYADTYNLYFKKPDAAAESDFVSKAESDPEPAKVVPQKVEVPASAGVIPNIIINNHITPPPAEKEKAAEAVIAPVPEPEDEPLPPVPTSTRRKALVQTVLGGHYFMNSSVGVFDPGFKVGSGMGMGASLGLKFNLTPGLSIGGWAGISQLRTHKYFGGGDVEFIPLRASAGSYDFFELGIMAGVSSLTPSSSDLGPVHFGVRSSLNFNDSTGLTSALRFNDDLFAFEVGIATAL